MNEAEKIKKAATKSLADMMSRLTDEQREKVMERFKALSETVVTDELIEELDRLAEAEARKNWQSIETAPKDGTSVLVYDGHIWIAEWYETNDRIKGWWAQDHSCNPTHWMHLPEPPNSEADAAMNAIAAHEKAAGVCYGEPPKGET